MSIPVAYRWTFDRTPFGHHDEFSTFSVGVYQWVPKASGKGLKKSKTIRVVGYVAEPERVYERAEELCRQLNEAHVRSDSVPNWVQKQYSVPKPAGMVIPRRSSELTASQVRSIRLQIMREELLPLGFVRCVGGAYVRRRGNQIHLIHFNGCGGEFQVSLAFHFTFVPPLFRRCTVGLSEFHLLDCGVRDLSALSLPEKRDAFFRYGEDRQQLRRTFQRCAAESLLMLDDYSERWGELREFYLAMRSGRNEQWHLTENDLVLGCVAMRIGLLDEAEQHLRTWIVNSRIHADRRVFDELLQNLHDLRMGPPGSQVPLNWIVG